MSVSEFEKRLKLDDSLVRKIGFNPYYCHLQSGLDDPIIIDNREFINLASNNYIGLANDSRVKTAISGAVMKYGASLCGTPIATGCIDLFKRVEQKLAKFVGLEDAIVIDHFAHSSLMQGAKTVGCKIRPFLHNNIEHLDGILKNLKGFRQIFIVTESVFSTEGSIAPFREIVELSRKYGAIPVVDDSHGIGVLGKSGRGVLEYFQISNYEGIYTASLGKSLANSGGIIAGTKTLADHLRYYCPHLIYSTALTPGVLGGVESVLDIIGSEFGKISKKMWEYREIIRRDLLDSGFTVSPGEAPINSINMGNPGNSLLLSKKFFEKGILVTPFIYPSVPLNDGKVRLIAGANLKEETVSRASKIIREISKQ